MGRERGGRGSHCQRMLSITKGSSTNQRLEINRIRKSGIGSLHSTYSEDGMLSEIYFETA